MNSTNPLGPNAPSALFVTTADILNHVKITKRENHTEDTHSHTRRHMHGDAGRNCNACSCQSEN